MSKSRAPGMVIAVAAGVALWLAGGLAVWWGLMHYCALQANQPGVSVDIDELEQQARAYLQYCFISTGVAGCSFTQSLWPQKTNNRDAALGITRKLLNSLVVLTIVLGVFIWTDKSKPAIVKSGISEAPNAHKIAEIAQPLNQFLVEISNLTNSDLPRMVDADTRLDTTFVKGNDFYYKYTLVGYEHIQLNTSFLAREYTHHITKQSCKTLQKEIRKGASIIHLYYSNDAKLALKVSVTPKQCEH